MIRRSIMVGLWYNSGTNSPQKVQRIVLYKIIYIIIEFLIRLTYNNLWFVKSSVAILLLILKICSKMFDVPNYCS